jgi:indole-3-glycerol phosphate synthase
MNFLETILAHKREEVAAKKKLVLRTQLEDMPNYSNTRLSLSGALRDKQMAVIAEIKKASPSKKVLREDFDPLDIARQFLVGGANALSVITDEKFFQGNLKFIERMRNFVSVPILRKDFIIDPYQLYEAKASGADAVLLIAAANEPPKLAELLLESHELGLDCLVELHSEEEIDRMDFSAIKLAGINNRDLMTFDTDIMTSVRLRKNIPSDVIVVSESGIQTPKDIELLMSHGIQAVLIGEMLMRSASPGKALADLLGNVKGVRTES